MPGWHGGPGTKLASLTGSSQKTRSQRAQLIPALESLEDEHWTLDLFEAPVQEEKIFGAVLSCCERCGRWQQVLALMASMGSQSPESGMIPSTACYNCAAPRVGFALYIGLLFVCLKPGFVCSLQHQPVVPTSSFR